MNDYKFNTTTMCIEGKHLLCDGELRFDDWERQCTCNCLCHNIIYAIMIDHHILENEAKLIANRVMKVALIAASPQMYEACQEAIEEMFTCELQVDEKSASRIECTRHMLEQAVAKAEGK